MSHIFLIIIQRTDSSCAENEEILDPLRHHDIFDEVNVEHGSAEAALTSDASSMHSGGTSIPIRLPAHICMRLWFSFLRGSSNSPYFKLLRYWSFEYLFCC